MSPLHQAFIVTLDDIYEFIETKCPQFQNHVEMSRMYTNSLATISSSLFVNEIYKVIQPFKQEIMDCNQTFFLNFDTYTTGIDTSQSQSHFLSLKDIWLSDTLTILDKAHTWHLFQQLVKIGDKLTCY
jgi:hypothetical protein